MENKTPNIQHTMPEQRRKQPVGLIILLIVLFVTASILTIVFFNLTRKQEKEIINMIHQKDSLESELLTMVDDYELMKTENDSINVLLEAQQDYIRKLITKEAGNKEKIRMYQKELKTLREIMRSYIVQVDSLNTRNQLLTAENVEIKSKLTQTQEEREKLKLEKEELGSKVELASVLSAKNITAIPLNKNSKERNKAKTIEKIKTCFTVRENKIVESGSKTIFLRIYRPDGFLMTPSAENIFETKDGTLIYSAKRQLEYENEDIEICIFYDKTEEFVEGTYSVELYAEANKIGETTFTLK